MLLVVVHILLVVVAAQLEEQQHSVHADWVRIPIQTHLFKFRMAVNLFLLGVRLSLRTFCRMVLFPTPSSSFLFPIIISRCKLINCNLTM